LPDKSPLEQFFESNESVARQAAPEVGHAVEETARQVVGRGANAVGLGVSGAQMAGPLGGLLGGLAGAAMPPSGNPGMDVGMVGGEALAGMLTGGKGRLIQGFAKLLGAGTGGATGAMVDRLSKPDMTHETPWGQIGLYVGIDALALAAGGVMGKLLSPTPLVDDVAKVKGATGVDVPLGMGERFGGPIETMSRFFSPGQGAGARLTKMQSDALTKATDKLLSIDIRKPTPAVEAAGKSRVDLKGAVEDWREANAVTVREPTGMVDSRGRDLFRDVKKLPPREDFGRSLGMDKEETSLFFSAIESDTQGFLDKLLGGNKETRLRGLIALRGVIKAADDTDDTLGATIGAGLVTRVLKEGGAFSCDIACGQQFHKALFENFGKDKLQLVLGREKTEALETLANVIQKIDPAAKLNLVENGVSPGQRGASYVGQKLLFTMSSTGAGILGGTRVGSEPLLTAMAGGAIGLTLALPAYAFIAQTLSNPALAKMFQAFAENGDPLLGARLVRTVMSGQQSQRQERQAIAPTSTPRTKLEELFAK
jgi:hypothetical protein